MVGLVEVKLRTQDATIRLSADDRQWCQVELEVGERRAVLGAESRMVVIQRLLLGLEDELSGKRSGELAGHPVRWVASFSERHCSVYACDVGGERHLFFQAANGDLLATVLISREQRHEWARTLEDWGREP